MVEFTYTELILFVWAVVATGFAYMYREKEHNHGVFVSALIKNKDLREDFFDKMDEEIKEKRA